MTKKMLLVIGLLVVGAVCLFLIIGLPHGFGPCSSYRVVGEFDQPIESEGDAKRIALEYYSSIGYDFDFEDVAARNNGDGWSIWIVSSEPQIDHVCVTEPDPELCKRMELIELNAQLNLLLEEHLFGKNKILKRYPVAC